MRQLLAGVWMIGIGVPLMNGIRFVGVIYVPQRVAAPRDSVFDCSRLRLYSRA
jgi:hypothetical protein